MENNQTTSVSHGKQMLIAAIGIAVLAAIGGYWYMNNKDMLGGATYQDQDEAMRMMNEPVGSEETVTEFDTELEASTVNEEEYFADIDASIDGI